MTFIQRFGSKLNLNVHLHLLVLVSWMARLKRVFNLDISVCPKCGGKVRVIATVTEPNAIAQILVHLHRRDHDTGEPRGPPPRLLG